MVHFLEKRDPWGNGWAVWVLGLMAFMIPLAAWGVSGIRMDHGLREWIPGDSQVAAQYQWYKTHFPGEEPLLLTWEGSSLHDPRVARFAAKIRGQTDASGVRRGGLKQVARVITPLELISQMVRNGVAEAEAVKRVQGVLIGPGSLRIRLTDAGRADVDSVRELLRRRAKEQLGLALNFAPPESPPVGDDADQTTDTPLARPPQHDFLVSWPEMAARSEEVARFCSMALEIKTPSIATAGEELPLIEDCFIAAGSPVGVAIELSEAGRADRDATFRVLRQVAVSLGVGEDQVHIGGGAFADWALNQNVLKSVWNLAEPWYALHQRSALAVSWLVIAGLACWFLGRTKVAAAVVFAAAITTLIATALVPLSGGTMNIVLILAPTLVLAATAAGTIPLVDQWRQAVQAQSHQPVVDALNAAWRPCLFAGLSVAIGLAALGLNSLGPVRALGIYAALGVLLGLGVLLIGLPALLQFCPMQPTVQDPDDIDSWSTIATGILRHSRKLAGLGGVVLLAGTCGLARIRTEQQVLPHLTDCALNAREIGYIERNLAGCAPVEIVVRFDQESQAELKFIDRLELVRSIEQNLRTLPDVSGALSLADFTPVFEAAPAPTHARNKIVQAAKTRARAAQSRAIEEALTTTHRDLARELLTAASEGGPLNAPGDELWRIVANAAVLPRAGHAALLADMEQICQSVLKRTSGRSESKYRAATARVGYHPGASHVITGSAPLLLAVRAELPRGFIITSLAAFFGLVGIMALILRHVAAGTLVMLPNALAVGCVLGIAAWSNVEIDLAATLAPAIALGVACGIAVPMVDRFRNEVAAGQPRGAAAIAAFAACSPAMLRAGLIACLGLWALGVSKLPFLNHFGGYAAAMIATALIGNLVLTPILLAGLVGRLLERAHLNPAGLSARVAPPLQTHEAAPIPKPHLDTAAARVHRVD